MVTNIIEIGPSRRPLRRVDQSSADRGFAAHPAPRDTPDSPARAGTPGPSPRGFVARRQGRAPRAPIPVAFALAVLAVLAVAAPEQAAAQTVTTFLSTTGQSTSFGANAIRATRFTTGGATYTLSSVGIHLDVQPSPAPTPLVQIYSNTGSGIGAPDTLVATLTNPATVVNSVVNIFTAPANTTLTASTKYWVVTSNSTVAGFRVWTTTSTVPDSGAAAGWLLGSALFKNLPADAWDNSSGRHRFEIRGTAQNAAPTVANAIPDQTATVGTAFSYQFPTNTFNDIDTLSYTATKADDTTLPTWLTFTAGTRTFTGTPAASDAETLAVKVTATDTSSATVTDEFDITVRDPNGGICPRTEAVRDALLAKITGVTDCALVTDTHLAAITFTLSLNAKSITVLAAGDFDGLTALTTLNLSYNSLTGLPAGIFDELTALTWLNLENNSLTGLPAGVFDKLTVLQRLWVNFNSLTGLPAGIFDELTALTTLDLKNNLLTALPAGVFDELTALTFLDLENNSLAALPAGVFDKLTVLQRLHVNLNSLTALPAGVFDKLTALTTLDLENNSLTGLPDDVFDKLTALTTLVLSGNPGVPFSPTAVALPDDGTVPAAGGTVMLDGSGSGGAWGTNVTYSWALTTPTTGVTVTFDNDSIAEPTVTIPQVTADTDLVFTLTVTGRGSGAGSGGFSTATDTAAVTTTTPTNAAPTVANVIPDQTATVGTAFSYQFPTNTFNDTDTSDTLSYTATQADGTDLPTWLTFTAATRTFTGTPAASDVETVAVEVTATDTSSATVMDEFNITVADTATAPGAPTGLTATASGTTTINLSWTAPASNGGSAITGYQIEVSPDGITNWTDQVANTNNATTTYAHAGLQAGITRYYRVSAINANSTGPVSNTAVATTSAGGGTNLLLNFGTASDSYPIKVFESRDTQHRFVLSLRTRPDAAPDGNPQQPVTIPLLVTHVGGATTEDYEGLPASVTFGVGESEADFDLRAIPDQTKEIGEGLRLDFGALPPGVTKGTWGPYEIIEFLDEIRPWVTASFGAEAYTATEGGGAAGVSIHLSEPVDLEPLEVGLLLEYGGGATAADHGSIPEVVTFAVGEQTKTITVTATDDTDDDDGESVSLSFVNDPNDRVTTGGAATLALVDNDGPAQVMVSFGAATYTATEGGAAATVRVELDAAPGRAVTVPLPPVHVGGATAADYSGLPASVTFGANQTAQTFTVTATPDTDSDGGESVSIGFGALPPGVFAGHPASAAVTLADGSEQTLVVDFGTASNSNVIKVREGLVIHRFTLILDSAPQLPVTIPLVVTHVGGATAADYTELPASVTFGVGESVVGFDLRAIPDETKEIGEGLRLDFGTLPPGVTKGTWGPYETLEFVDVGAEQVMVSFGAATYTATEGGAAATVRVELDAAPGRPVTVPRATAFTTGTRTYTLSSVVIPLTTADVGGATAADYSGIPETVTFAANQTAVTFTVTATADTDADGGDSVSIGFGTLPAGVFAGSPATTVTLADDSGPGPTPMTMTARFTHTPSEHDGSNGFELHMEFSHEPENFSYRTVQGALFDIEGGRIERVWRRERGKDRQWGMVVAPDGGGAVTLVARATSDCAAQNAVCDAEGGKFAGDLSLTVPGPASSSLPVVSIVASATPVTEGTAAAFTLSRTGATDAALTLTVSVSESEASVSGTPPTSVTFAAASASATLSVATEDDEVAEDASTVTATVSSGSGYTVSGTSGSADVVVEDDDAPPVVTTASPIVVAENATSVATLSATDADTAAADLSWSIPAGAAGGADGAKFALTADGALSFKAAKDYEAPDDTDTDGQYEVTVRVTDGVNPVDAALVVRLEDADDDTGPTASFEALPERHDGTAAFRFELHFSEEPSGLSYRTVGGGLLEVTGGTLTHARRLTRGRNQGWEVTVVPTQAGDIVITLPARSCGEADAICIDGAPLARAATATVPGPASSTPAASGTVTVDLPAGAAEDDAGNESEAASQFSIAAELNTTAPTVAISTAASAPVNGPFTVTFTFSEEVTGFELTDLVVGNGSSSALQGDGASYTATITPEASGTVTVDVPAGGAEDSAGNPSVAAQQFSIAAELTAVDDVAPRVTITGPATEPVIGPFSITVIFSEPVTGFELEDVVVGNGVASELEGDGARYTATVTPTAPGPVTVDIAAGAAEDSAGNPSMAADQFSITVELTPVPALPLAGVIALAALLLIGVIRRRAGDAV